MRLNPECATNASPPPPSRPQFHSYVPVIGWSWYFLEYIFLARSWDKDRPHLVKAIRRLGDFPFPFWVIPPPLHFPSNKFFHHPPPSELIHTHAPAPPPKRDKPNEKKSVT